MSDSPRPPEPDRPSEKILVRCKEHEGCWNLIPVPAPAPELVNTLNRMAQEAGIEVRIPASGEPEGAPKPEMLEKAREVCIAIHGAANHEGTECNSCVRVALALEEADFRGAFGLDGHTKHCPASFDWTGGEIICLYCRLQRSEAETEKLWTVLRASETAVESAQRMYLGAQEAVNLLTESVATAIAEREATRAEATKAEGLIRAAKDYAAADAVRDTDEDAQRRCWVAMDQLRHHARLMFPSSPTPPTSPPTEEPIYKESHECSVCRGGFEEKGRRFTCPECRKLWVPSPEPPRAEKEKEFPYEEPCPACRDWYKRMGITKADPTPGPTEEP
jgi:hypothetical protein